MKAIGTLLGFLYRQARGLASLAIAAGLVSGAAGAAQLAILNAAIDQDDAHRRLALFAGFAALLLVAPASRLVCQYLMVKLGQDVVYDLRLRLAGLIVSAPLAHLERLGPSKLLAALTDDTSAITEALIVVPEVASNGALFLAGLVYLGWLSPLLLTAFLTLFVPVLVLYRFPVASAFERYRLAREEQDVLYGAFTGVTAGAKELKLNAERRAAFFGRLAATAGGLRRLFVRANVTLAAAVAGAWTFFMAAVGLILFGAPLVRPVPRQTLVGYALVLLFLRGPLQLVVGSFTALGRGGVGLRKLERLGFEMRQSAEAAEPAAPAAAGRAVAAAGAAGAAAGWRRLDLEGVTFSFHREDGEADFLLGPVDLTLRPGELVFLIGANGSGKTSFAKLLAGLYEPATGEIRWDGERVDRAGLDRYRQNFSAVFHDFYLFAELPGAARPDLAEVSRRYLRDLHLTGKVEIADGRLSTTDLSQGQRKRLALLAAYLEDRPIYLFDEWAADQDPYFKEVFYRRIVPRLREAGKTVVVISHDDRYFDVADRIVRFDEGRVSFGGPATPAKIGSSIDASSTTMHERECV